MACGASPATVHFRVRRLPRRGVSTRSIPHRPEAGRTAPRLRACACRKSNSHIQTIPQPPNDADRVNAYFISVDPERDNIQAMKDYLSSFDPHLKGLTGDPAAVAKITSEYRVYARKVPLRDGDYTMDHTALVYLMDRDGKFAAPFNLKRTPQEAAADLKRYL